MPAIEPEEFVEEFRQGHWPEANWSRAGRHGTHHARSLRPVSSCLRSIRTCAATAARAASGGRRARRLAGAHPGEGREHRFGIGALAAGADLALAAAGVTAEDVKRLAARQAGE